MTIEAQNPTDSEATLAAAEAERLANDAALNAENEAREAEAAAKAAEDAQQVELAKASEASVQQQQADMAINEETRLRGQRVAKV